MLAQLEQLELLELLKLLVLQLELLLWLALAGPEPARPAPGLAPVPGGRIETPSGCHDCQ